MMSLWSLLSGNPVDHSDAPPQDDSEHVSIPGSMPPTPKPIRSTKSTPPIVNSTPVQSPIKEKEKLLSVTFIDGTILDYDEPYVGQGYPGGTSAANALVGLIYGLKKTNFKRGAEASVKGDHVRWVDGATDKSVKLVDIDFGPGGALIYVFLPKTWVHKHCTTIGGSLNQGVVKLFWNGFSEHPMICGVRANAFRSHTYPKISRQLEHFDRSKCGSLILGLKGDLGSNLVEKYIGNMNRASKVILLEAEIEGEAGSSSGNRSSLPSVSITGLFRYRDPGDVASEGSSSLGLSQSYSGTQAGSSRHRLSNRTSPESYGEESVDQHTSARQSNASRRPRDSGSKSSPQIDGADQGRRKKRDKGSRSNPGRLPGLNACNVHCLHPSGCQNDKCPYRHDLEMSQAYLKVMAYHSKKMACPWASFDKCPMSAEECPIGHVCPFGKNCKRPRTCIFDRIAGAHGEEGDYDDYDDYDDNDGY